LKDDIEALTALFEGESLPKKIEFFPVDKQACCANLGMQQVQDLAAYSPSKATSIIVMDSGLKSMAKNPPTIGS